MAIVIRSMIVALRSKPASGISKSTLAPMSRPGSRRMATLNARSRMSAIARAAYADPRVKANIRDIDGEAAMLEILEAAF